MKKREKVLMIFSMIGKRAKIVFGFLLLLEVGERPSAFAGVCKGEGEKVVLYLEYVFRRAENLINAALDGTGKTATAARLELGSYAGEIAVFLARNTLCEKLLAGEDSLPQAMESAARELENLLQKIKGAGEKDAAAVRQALERTVLEYAHCLAVAKQDHDFCNAIVFDAEEAGKCKKDVVWELILLGGKCDEKSLKMMSDEMGIALETFVLACRIFAEREPQKCAQLGRWENTCLIALSDDENACEKWAEKEPEKQQKCRESWQTSRQLRYREEISWQEAMKLPVRAALAGAFVPHRCLELALEVWNGSIGYPFHR